MKTTTEAKKDLKKIQDSFKRKLRGFDEGYSNGAAKRMLIDNLILVANNRRGQALAAYSQYGNGHFAKDKITDGKQTPHEDTEACCHATRNLIVAEEALTSTYEKDIKDIISKSNTSITKWGFYGIDKGDVVSHYNELTGDIDFISAMIENYEQDHDPSTLDQLNESIRQLNDKIDRVRLYTDTLTDNLVDSGIENCKNEDRDFRSNYSDLLTLINQTYGNHISCHRDPDKCFLTIYNDAYKYTAQNQATEGETFEIEKNVPLKDQANINDIRNALKRKTNDEVCKFAFWVGGTENLENLFFSEDASIYGCWDILPKITWEFLDDDTKPKEQNTVRQQFFTNITNYLNQSWDAFESQYGTKYDEITPRYTGDILIKPSEREWTIQRRKKNYVVNVATRWKGVNGWGDYRVDLETNQVVKHGDDYKIIDLPMSYMMTIKEGHFTETSPDGASSGEYALGNGSTGNYKNIVANTTFYIDITPFYSVKYLDGFGKSIEEGTKKNIEVGTNFDVSANAPEGYPPEYIMDENKKVYKLNEANPYTPTGTIVIDDNKKISANYGDNPNPTHITAWNYTLSAEFEYDKDKENAEVAPLLTDIETVKNLTAEAMAYREDKSSNAFDSIRTTDNGKWTIKESEDPFTDPIDDHYPMLRDVENDSYKKAKYGSTIWSLSRGLPIKTYLENPSIYTAYFKTFTDEYELNCYARHGNSSSEIVKTVVRLPKTADDKLATGAVGWPNGYAVSAIITRNNNNPIWANPDAEYIITELDETWKDKNATYKGIAGELPYVHFIWEGLSGSIWEEIQQFNPLTDDTFAPAGGTIDPDGYIGYWKEADANGKLTATLKELDDPHFFDALYFHHALKKLPYVHFIYGDGFVHEGNEICSTWFDPRNPSINFPNFNPSDFKEDYTNPVSCDKTTDDFRRNEGDPNFFDDITATFDATTEEKLSASIQWQYGPAILGDTYDGKTLTGNVWLKSTNQQKEPVILAYGPTHLNNHSDEEIENPPVSDVMFNDSKFKNVDWDTKFALSDFTWTSNPMDIQTATVQLTGNLTDLSVTFKAFVDEIGAGFIPDYTHVVSFGYDLSGNGEESTIYTQMISEINEALTNTWFYVTPTQPHWKHNGVDATNELTCVMSDLTVDINFNTETRTE